MQNSSPNLWGDITGIPAREINVWKHYIRAAASHLTERTESSFGKASHKKEIKNSELGMNSVLCALFSRYANRKVGEKDYAAN